jgi:hypothetical protein
MAKLDKEVCVVKDAIKESSEDILRRQGENVEQMQLQAHQENLSIEDKVEKLDSQIAELTGLVFVRINIDSVLRTPSSADYNIANNMNGQIASCFSSGTSDCMRSLPICTTNL